jgi:DNA-binding XRE family transcriptional regulator
MPSMREYRICLERPPRLRIGRRARFLGARAEEAVMKKGKNARSTMYRAFGGAVRESRARRGLSQEALGFAADLHRNYVGAVERGEINPTLRIIFKLARGLAMLPSELMALAERHHGALEDGGHDAG